MKLKKIYILVLFLIGSLHLFSQSDSIKGSKKLAIKNLALSVIYQNGYVFGTNDFLRGVNIEAEKIRAFQTFSVNISQQTYGDRLWEQLFNYPDWGMGIYVGDFYNPEEIGVPIALYGFLNAPFKRWKKVSFNYELGFGAAFNWKSYNPITNRYNSAIGAGESFLIDAGLNLEFKLNSRIDLVTGFSLTHFSNGAIKRPNLGINTVAPKISLKYNFGEQSNFIEQVVPKYIQENEWIVSVFAGVKNLIYDSVNIDIIEKYEGVFFPVYGISAAYNRQISYKSKIGLGFNLAFDESVNAQVAIEDNELEAIDGPFSDKILVSVYPSYELVMNKISLILQPSFYVYRKQLKQQSPVFHQRIGIKYHIKDDLFIGISLRDYQFHVSDFIEWNIGYRIHTK